MPELRLTTPPPRDELLRALLPRLPDVIPGMRLIAEGLLGAEGRIDFVAVEPSGRAVLVLVGGEGEDLELVGRALAQRAWVAARLDDWLQLAPDLGVRPEAGVRVLLVCHALRPATIAAAGQLGARALGLARYRCVRNGAGIELLVEVELPDEDAPAAPHAAPREAPGRFRTGLSDDDLGLSAAERSAFDSPRGDDSRRR